MRNKLKAIFSCCALVIAFQIVPLYSFAGTLAEGVTERPLNKVAIAMFVVFVLTTLGITWWASRQSGSRSEYYAAGGSIPAWVNGVAICGDFISASTFLGITSVLYFSGLDGMMLIVGSLASWPVILFLVAERLRNLGKYTFIDVISYRLSGGSIRMVASLGALTVVIFYLIGQVVGAGKLIQLLFGLDYIYAVVSVSLLMILYVSFGGMVATTWVQFIKALLLLVGGTALTVLVLLHFEFDLEKLFQSAVETHPLELELLAPGGWLDDPLSVVSVGITLLFGFVGLPHILMRMFTVKDAKAASRSVFYTIAIVGVFNLFVILIGFGAISILSDLPEYHSADGAMIGGKNMVALHLSHVLGGNLLLGFISAITFATILAVVSGLALAGAATIAHDIYAKILCKGEVSEKAEVLISRVSVFFLGVLAIVLGIAFEDFNVVFITTMSLAVAASVNTPVLLMSMYWKGLTSRGALTGCVVGLVSSVSLILLGPQVMVDVLGFAQPVFPYVYPSLASVPLAFMAIIVVSVLDNSERGKAERAAFRYQYIQSQTGAL